MNLLFMQNGLPPYGIPRSGLVSIIDAGRQILTGTTGQTLIDYTGRGNTFQLGSTAGSDTNDPAWSGNGLTLGTDDFCKSSSPAFDDMQAFTCITVLKYNSAINYQRIFDKSHGATITGPIFSVDVGIPTFTRYVTNSANFYKWASNSSLTTNTDYCIGLRSNRGGESADSIVSVGKSHTTTYSTSGTPAITSDAVDDLFIGNRSIADRSIASTLYLQLWYNRVLTDAEYMQAYNGLRSLMNKRGVVI